MAKKWLIAIMIAGGVSGCTSMLPHYRFSDTAVEKQAEGMAVAMTCAEKGLAPGELVYAYGYAVSQLYSVSVYDKELYENTFKQRKSDFDSYFPHSYSSRCAGIPVHFPRMTANTLQQYSEIARNRQAALIGMGESAASIGRDIQTNNQQPIVAPTGEVDFALPESKVNHYLVDFGSGQRMCTATQSGYVFCN